MEVPRRASRWWKFDSYDISDGVIHPAPGATLQSYDPWALGSRDWRGFVEVARLARQGAVERDQPNSAGESYIIDWCNRYGLLGILPLQAQAIVLPPSFEPDGSVVQRKYERSGTMWHCHAKAVAGGAEETAMPYMSCWDWDRFEWRNIDTESGLSRFFRIKPPRGQYPRPLSREFWTTYQEPVVAWMRCAAMFCDAVDRLWQPGLAGGEQALRRLNALADPHNDHDEFGPGALQREWVSTSLLSEIAEMFLADLSSELSQTFA